MVGTLSLMGLASDGGRLSDLRVVVVAVAASVDDHFLVVQVFFVSTEINLSVRHFIRNLLHQLSRALREGS